MFIDNIAVRDALMCHHRGQRKLGDEVELMWRRGLLRGQAWHFRHLRLDLRGNEVGLMWRRGLLRGRRGTFGTSGSICVAGVALSVPSCGGRGRRRWSA